jgi:hypothetical protein
MHTRIHIFATCFLLIVMLLVPYSAGALFLQPDNQLELTVAPQFPAPDSFMTVSLASFGSNTKDATITWFVNGKQSTTTQNERSITVPTGDGTTSVRVEARITSPTLGTKTLVRTLVPGAVDIIAEPDTTVPEGFMGRPHPAALSPVRLIALPQFYQKSGIIPKKDIIFTWTLNGETLMGGSQLGTDSTVITMPRYGEAEVVVVAETRDGSRVARGSIVLTPTKPHMVLYEENTLFGTRLVAPSRFSTTKEELTVRATPYYVHKNAVRPGAIEYAWRVDGKNIAQGADVFTITLLRANGSRQHVDLTYSSMGETLMIGQGRFSADFIDDTLITL